MQTSDNYPEKILTLVKNFSKKQLPPTSERFFASIVSIFNEQFQVNEFILKIVPNEKVSLILNMPKEFILFRLNDVVEKMNSEDVSRIHFTFKKTYIKAVFVFGDCSQKYVYVNEDRIKIFKTRKSDELWKKFLAKYRSLLTGGDLYSWCKEIHYEMCKSQICLDNYEMHISKTDKANQITLHIEGLKTLEYDVIETILFKNVKGLRNVIYDILINETIKIKIDMEKKLAYQFTYIGRVLTIGNDSNKIKKKRRMKIFDQEKSEITQLNKKQK